MAEFFANHWGDLVVGGLLAAVAATILVGMIRGKHRGGCCGNCSRCRGKKDKCEGE